MKTSVSAALFLTVSLLLSPSGTPVQAGGPSCGAPAIEAGGASDTRQSAGDLKVVTLNTARETDVAHILKDVSGVPAVADADVWLLQEIVKVEGAEGSVAARLADAFGAHYVFAAADVLDGGKLLSGLAILSRYPLQNPRVNPLVHHDLKFNTRCRIGLEATVLAPAGPVRVVNMHLDTRISKDQRVRQVLPVLDATRDWHEPVVIGGDFNSANIRWIGNVLPIPLGQNQVNPLQAAFRSHGFFASPNGTQGTFNLLGVELNLDWIFTRGFTPVASGVANVRFSDHEAAWVRLALTSPPVAPH